jgi:hypothetical protein
MKRATIALLLLCATAMARDAAMQKMPASLFFVANEGQWEEPFAFKAAVGNAVYYITPTGMTMDIREYDRSQRARNPMDRFERMREQEPTTVRGHVLRMDFVNANAHPKIIGEDKLSSYSNYFLGRDSCKWRSFVGHYQTVRMKNVWNGIDVEYRIQREGVETLYRVQAGANAAQINVQVEGLTAPLRVDGAGNLILSTSLGEVKEKAPFAHQIVNHRQVEVPVRYQVQANDKYSLSFEVFDTGHELVIDPLVYSTYFAGSLHDFLYSLDRDSLSNLVIGGVSDRADFPTTPGAYHETSSEGWGGFVCKLAPEGHSLIYGTYIGTNSGGIQIVRVNRHGEMYVLALTNNGVGWPITSNAFDTVAEGYEIGFARLSANGSTLEFSSYLGGNSFEEAHDCTIDSLGKVYILGETSSPDFPTTPDALFPTHPSNNRRYTFAAVFDPQSESITYATYFTNANIENLPGSMALIEPGVLWVSLIASGITGMPITSGALQDSGYGSTSYFALVDLNHDSVLYGSYLGRVEPRVDVLCQMIPIGMQRVYLMGIAYSPDFPMPPGGYDSSPPDSFGKVFVLDLQLPNTLLHGTFVGGRCVAWPYAFTRIDSGSLLFDGLAMDEGFPTTPDAFNEHYSGGFDTERGDVILFKLSPDLTRLEYGTYFGGSSIDYPEGEMVCTSGNVVWLAGWTYSPWLPISPDALFQRRSSSFLLRLDFSDQSVPNENRDEIPEHLELSCFPNPFNPSTTISFSLPKPSSVNLQIFDILGRIVYAVECGRLSAGTYHHTFDASDLASGVYFARLKTSAEIRTTKLLLVR